MDRRKMLQDHLAQNPQDVFARYGLALDYANAGETQAALDEFQQLLTMHPDYTAGYQMAAQTLVKAGRTEEARPLLEQGIACAERTGNQHAQREMRGLLEELEIF